MSIKSEMLQSGLEVMDGLLPPRAMRRLVEILDTHAKADADCDDVISAWAVDVAPSEGE